MGIRELLFKITGQESVSEAAKKAEDSLGSFEKFASGVAKRLAALGIGVAIGQFFKSSIEEAAKAEDGMVRLGQAVANAGGDFSQVRPQIDETVNRLTRLTVYTDDELNDALTRLVVITGDVPLSLRTLGTAADLAAYKNIGLGDAADAVGKALEGNTRALRALGIQTKDGVAGIDELAIKVGGFAENQGKTFSGSLARINNSWSEFKERVGQAILGNDNFRGATDAIIGLLVKLEEWVAKNSDQLSGYTEKIGEALAKFVDWIANSKDVRQGLADVWSIIRDVVGALADFKRWADSTGTSLSKAGAAIVKWTDPLFLLKKLLGKDVPEAAKDGGDRTEKAVTLSTVKITATATDGQRTITKVHAEESDKREKKTKEAAEREAKLLEEANKRNIASLEALGRAFTKELEGKATKGAAALEKIATLLGVDIGTVGKAGIEETARQIDAMLPLAEELYKKGKISADQWEFIRARAHEHKDTLRELLPDVEKMRADIEAYKDHQKGAADAAADNAKHAKTVGLSIADAARAALDLGQSFGVVDAKAASALNSVVNMGQSIAKVAGGDMSGVLGIVGSLANIIAGLGNSEAHRKIREALAANTEAIRDSTSALTTGATGSEISGVQSAIAAALKVRESGGSKEEAFTAFAATASAAGISSARMKEILQRLGLSGVMESFDTNILRQANQFFQNGLNRPTYGNELDFLRQSFDVQGASDQERLSRLADLASRYSPALRLAFRGGVDSSEARSAAATNLRGLWEHTAPGHFDLDPGSLGSLTVQQFRDLIAMLLPLLGATVPSGGTSGAPMASLPPLSQGGEVGLGLPSMPSLPALPGVGGGGLLGGVSAPSLTANVPSLAAITVTGGFHVEQITVVSPDPEAAGESVVRSLELRFGESYNRIRSARGSALISV